MLGLALQIQSSIISHAGAEQFCHCWKPGKKLDPEWVPERKICKVEPYMHNKTETDMNIEGITHATSSGLRHIFNRLLIMHCYLVATHETSGCKRQTCLRYVHPRSNRQRFWLGDHSGGCPIPHMCRSMSRPQCGRGGLRHCHVPNQGIFCRHHA